MEGHLTLLLNLLLLVGPLVVTLKDETTFFNHDLGSITNILISSVFFSERVRFSYVSDGISYIINGSSFANCMKF